MPRPSKRQRIEPTEEWEQLELLFTSPEQRVYEQIRPVVLLGGTEQPIEVAFRQGLGRKGHARDVRRGLAARADDHARQDRRYSGRSVCLARRADRRCRVPYGYHRELAKAVISIDDQAAVVVRRIVARRAAGVILRDLRHR